VRAHDAPLYQAAADRLTQLSGEWFTAELAANKAKVMKRLAKYQSDGEA
jgi:hypothetical protein